MRINIYNIGDIGGELPPPPPPEEQVPLGQGRGGDSIELPCIRDLGVGNLGGK